MYRKLPSNSTGGVLWNTLHQHYWYHKIGKLKKLLKPEYQTLEAAFLCLHQAHSWDSSIFRVHRMIPRHGYIRTDHTYSLHFQEILYVHITFLGNTWHMWLSLTHAQFNELVVFGGSWEEVRCLPQAVRCLTWSPGHAQSLCYLAHNLKDSWNQSCVGLARLPSKEHAHCLLTLSCLS